MENKNNSKFYIIIFILCLLVLALCGYIVYGKTQNSKGTENIDKNKGKDSVETRKISKLDNSKDWVYDADYQKNTTADSYSTALKTYYAKDIVVPYININSQYAKTSNEEIKNVFDNLIQKYNDGVNNKITYIDNCNYQKNINDDYMSTVLTYGIGGTDIIHQNYYTYNISLKTGNELTYEEAYKIVGIDSNNIETKVESAITNIMKDKLQSFKDPKTENGNGIDYPDGTNFDTYNNKSIENYKSTLSNKSLKYFISDNKKLNIIVKLSIPAGTGEFDTIITVE